MTGKLVQPESGGSLYVTSPFGKRTSPGGVGSTNHKGTDIGGTATKIIAAMAGKVDISKYSSSAGNYIRILHGKDSSGRTIHTRYLHMSKRLKAVGATVAAGEQIGVEGATGNVTGAHLHFEVLVDGTQVDAETWFKEHGATLAVVGSEGWFPTPFELGERTLYKGLAGPDVGDWQRLVNEVLERSESKLAALVDDDDFGPKTDVGTRTAQAIAGVDDDGKVTAADITAVLDYLARPVVTVDIPKTPGGLTAGPMVPPLATGTTNTTGGPGVPEPLPTKGASMELAKEAVVSRAASVWFSFVRTVVPALWVALAGLLFDHFGVEVPAEIAEGVVMIALAGGFALWYLVARLIEDYGPSWIRWLAKPMLGISRPPVYVETAANGEIQARAPPSTS